MCTLGHISRQEGGVSSGLRRDSKELLPLNHTSAGSSGFPRLSYFQRLSEDSRRRPDSTWPLTTTRSTRPKRNDCDSDQEALARNQKILLPRAPMLSCPAFAGNL